jgi:hypothetical protein
MFIMKDSMNSQMKRFTGQGLGCWEACCWVFLSMESMCVCLLAEGCVPKPGTYLSLLVSEFCQGFIM